MPLSDLTQMITDNAPWMIFVAVFGFVLWKFIIQPRLNAGDPIYKTKEEFKKEAEEKEKNRFKFSDVIDPNMTESLIQEL